MRFLPAAGMFTVFLAASTASAEPTVVTDIPAIQSLVARVTEGVGMPESIVSADASHHHFDLRPSQARTLAEADIVFWVGEALEPWLAASIESLASEAVVVELMDLPDMLLLEYPDDDDHAGGHGHDHGDSDDDDHADGHGHDHGDSDDDDHADGHGHDHGDSDPHFWLDPRNGQIVMAAAVLAEFDPDHAGIYSANAEAGIAELEDLMTRIGAILSPVREVAFMTAHDSYRYFERRFGIEFVMSVADVDAGSPGPERLKLAQRIIEEENVVCIFIEPQIDDKMVRMVAEGSGARLGVLNVDGTGLETGTDFYPALIEGLPRSLADCLGESG